ncbi:hypothetical protein SPFL3102_03868 [Sporomusaceae bacterium FL31]|nr:hypothetical protein SPFL3101_00764 [Sporomusaceae bacterium FL31]GCE36003.1 hypothetical protein SPFL3102_03868 [Sporomusaceae bacterium]
MLKKMIISMIIFPLVLLFTSTCWAEEIPFGNITGPNDVIDKFFIGRTLDPIEGVWAQDPEKVMAIVKSTVLFPDQPQSHNYYMIRIKGSGKKGLGPWFDRTEYDFCFKEGKAIYKLLSPNLLEKTYDVNSWPFNEIFVRVYPGR